MKPIGIIDCETTGVDHAKDRVIEVAVAIVDPERGHLIEAWSSLVGPVGENAAESVNGIPGALLAHGRPFDVVADKVAKTGAALSCLIAHNADFDRQWFPEAVQKSAPWVCSMDDIIFPRTSSSKSLTAIALAHGLGISHAHRAMADVLLLARLFERVAELGANIPALLEHAMRPKKTYEVAAKGFDADQNARSKAAGFRWDASTKSWRKKMCPEDCASLGFAVREVLT